MDINQLLGESLQLLGLGMGAVFVILTLLIGLILLVSKLVPATTGPVIEPAPPGIDSNHVAAIAAAIHQHRKKR